MTETKNKIDKSTQWWEDKPFGAPCSQCRKAPMRHVGLYTEECPRCGHYYVYDFINDTVKEEGFRNHFCEQGEVLVLTNCSKSKANSPCQAKALYQGHIFQKALKLANRFKFDFYIISAKYGFLSGEAKIAPYDNEIVTKSDKDNLREQITDEFIQHIQTYKTIILAMGKKYREVIKPLLKHSDARILSVSSKKGYGGYLRKLDKLITMDPINFKKLILKRGGESDK
ncbi:MAG: hypothetical protein R6U96_04695 [Promethearchaeia archaeon]